VYLRRANSHEADFIKRLLKKNEKKLARSYNFTFRYIDDVLSLNNSMFGDFVDCTYSIELEIKDTWSFVTQIFHSGQPSHSGDRDDFNLTKRNHWFSSFLVTSSPLSRKS
jgi:hypothetical protein